jgi:hypothetical protein
MEEESTIREFLGDGPLADELHEMRVLLAERLSRLTRDLDEASDLDRPPLATRINALKEQVAALEQEELIARFVEDSVRVTLAMGRVVDGETEID